MRKLGNNTSSEFEGMQNIMLDRPAFKSCVTENIVLIAKAFRRQFILPEFQDFCRNIDNLYWNAKPNTSGEPANYIPQLARISPEYWGLAICTVDGQRYALGDANTPFCLQSISKPLTYALALNDVEPDVVHQYVGQEPSGQRFNIIGLNPQDKPHNPMVNSGAIVTSSLVKPELNLADRFDYTLKMFKRLAGDEFVSFNNSVFLSERDTADRNFAIAYHMKEKQCFPKGTNLMEIMDFYFQLCSVEMTCDSAAVVAATLANGGICPITDDKVLEPFCIRDTLSLMLSCGMYDYSGQFAFKVGLPGKSGVAGGIMLVVPNVMGIVMWSPPLDSYGNSMRGVQFCSELVKMFNFHNYDNIRFTTVKMDPCIRHVEQQANKIVDLLFSAYNGDVTAIRRCALSGMDMDQPDYDGRTALHVAAAEGQKHVVQFLLDKCNCSPFLVDRWGFTALDDAVRFKKPEVTQLLRTRMLQERPEFFEKEEKDDEKENDNEKNTDSEQNTATKCGTE
ncbi:glutaminase kidney isoform, mitochondrial-like [Littorina saxatilis]|uniref:glutaminase kidney isoform, mitochondrial-like n=1 Tax=Littorina saxatilis TaxID=31220 RepID=UPI0038B69EAA